MQACAETGATENDQKEGFLKKSLETVSDLEYTLYLKDAVAVLQNQIWELSDEDIVVGNQKRTVWFHPMNPNILVGSLCCHIRLHKVVDRYFGNLGNVLKWRNWVCNWLIGNILR